MIVRRPLLIPATLAVLVLGACGKDKDPAAATASAGSAGAGRIDSWSIVGPVVAGSQASGCTSLAQGGQAAAFTLAIDASSDAVLLFGHADPIDEPVVAHGPFVMNTRGEIEQAIRDYQAGKFNGDGKLLEVGA